MFVQQTLDPAGFESVPKGPKTLTWEAVELHNFPKRLSLKDVGHCKQPVAEFGVGLLRGQPPQTRRTRTSYGVRLTIVVSHPASLNVVCLSGSQCPDG